MENTTPNEETKQPEEQIKQPIPEKPAEPQKKEHEEDKAVHVAFTNMRTYSAIIIVIVLISNFTTWMSKETTNLIVMIMAILLISQSFTPYFQKSPKIRKLVMIGLALLLLLGVIVFFLIKK